jgi:hypothetical protein
MRTLFFILFITLSIQSFAQKKEWERAKSINSIASYEEFLKANPNSKYSKKAIEKIESLKTKTSFYVINARNCFLNDSSILEANTHLNHKQSIKIEDGFLILGHYSGKLMEYRGTHEIILEEISNTLKRYHFKNYTKIYSQTDTYLQGTGFMVGHNPLPILWISPARSSVTLEEYSLCLKWKTTDSSKKDSLHLVILNIYDEEIERIIIGGSQYDFDFSKYSDKRMLLLQLTSIDDPEIISDRIAIRVSERDIQYQPDLCSEPETALEALEIAFFLETNDQEEDAKKYFKLAVALGGEEYSIP